MSPYLVFKLIHILAVILFLGNIFTGLFWMYQANKTHNLSIINHTMKGIILSDRFFTVPGVIIIVAAGFGGAIHNHMPLLRTGWIFWSIVLFTISGIAYSWKLAPAQKKIYKFTMVDKDDPEFNWGHYKKLYREWDFWSLVSILTPIAALVLMVLKWPTGSIFHM